MASKLSIDVSEPVLQSLEPEEEEKEVPPLVVPYGVINAGKMGPVTWCLVGKIKEELFDLSRFLRDDADRRW